MLVGVDLVSVEPCLYSSTLCDFQIRCGRHVVYAEGDGVLAEVDGIVSIGSVSDDVGIVFLENVGLW